MEEEHQFTSTVSTPLLEDTLFNRKNKTVNTLQIYLIQHPIHCLH